MKVITENDEIDIEINVSPTDLCKKIVHKYFKNDYFVMAFSRIRMFEYHKIFIFEKQTIEYYKAMYTEEYNKLFFTDHRKMMYPAEVVIEIDEKFFKILKNRDTTISVINFIFNEFGGNKCKP